MKNFSLLLLMFSSAVLSAQTITATLDFTKTSTASTLLYGFNQDHESPTNNSTWTIRRLGGNRMSTFNWENGATNSGSDASYTNDNRIPSLLGVPWNDKDKPGEVYNVFHLGNLNNNIASIVTVPIQGWVANDKNGANTDTPPSTRYSELIYTKGSAFTLTPDVNDGKVYLDECINYLTQTFGGANTSSRVKYVALDNEPAYWDNTHGHIQSTAPNALNYVNKVIEAAKAVKSVDPNIKIIAGEFAGTNLYTFGNAPDWSTEGTGYDWYVSYFLDKLKMASLAAGYDLIDYISFHNYPQHKIDTDGNFSSSGTVVKGSTSTEMHIRNARMQFARSMWDESYTEPSWLTNSFLGGGANKILKRIQSSIDTQYPGLKIMVGEFDYGHSDDVSHGIGITDLLGVFNQYGVSIATRWDLETSSTGAYTDPAYGMFRNYNGVGGRYGNTIIESTFSNPDTASVWASSDSDDQDLHLILINKSQVNSKSFEVSLDDVNYDESVHEVWGFDHVSSIITAQTHDGIITGGKLVITVPKLSVFHVVIKRTAVVTGVLEQSKSALNLYPNPTSGIVNFGKVCHWKLIDNAGKFLLQGHGVSCDIAGLDGGTYQVIIDGKVYIVLKKN
ncbi:MAG: hypothetical protein ACJA0Q_001373 [Saprospiraceae bacterium]|jgi:hypothetical protein